MSVMPVRKIALVAFKADALALLKSLQAAGVFHIETSKQHTDQVFASIDAGRDKLLRIQSAIAFLKRFQAIASAIPPKKLPAEKLFEKTYAIAVQCSAIEQQIEALKHTIALYSPFGEFTENYDAITKAGLMLKLACVETAALMNMTNTVYSVVGTSATTSYVAFIGTPTDDVGIDFFDPPDASIPAMRARLDTLQTEACALREEASRWAYQLRTLETLAEKTEDHLELLTELRKAHDFDQLIGFNGYVLQRDTTSLKQALTKHTIAYSLDVPDVADTVPVMLKNPRPLRAFEAIVKAFTGVGYFEKDKTILVALLFMFFGALCLLDAGYGFLLFVFGYVIAIKKHRDFGQVFMLTGAFATVLGLLCGQVFGLEFAKDILLNIPPLLTLATNPMVCFQFSLLVGVLAMCLSNVTALIQNGVKTQASGSLLVIVGVLMLIVRESEILVGRFYDPAFTLTNGSIVCFSLGALLWLLFPDPVFGKQQRLGNILWMFYSGPLGLVQDVLSHMRLFGIALSGSILALVINKICALLPMPLGLLFAPIGHFTIFLLSLLSLYIHSNRLIFLEFGTKCMSGGNTYFKPFVRRD